MLDALLKSTDRAEAILKSYRKLKRTGVVEFGIRVRDGKPHLSDLEDSVCRVFPSPEIVECPTVVSEINELYDELVRRDGKAHGRLILRYSFFHGKLVDKQNKILQNSVL